MYSYEERMKAVKLFIKYDKSCMAVINELGYPCRGTLLAWYKEFSRKGDLNHVRMQRYRKVEFFYGRSWRGWSIEDFMAALDDYIHWYNEHRIKISFGGMSPL